MSRLLRREAMEVYTEPMDSETDGYGLDQINFFIRLRMLSGKTCGQCFHHDDNKKFCMFHNCYECSSEARVCVDVKDRSWGCVICGQVIRYNQKSEPYECESGKGFVVHTKCKDIVARQTQWKNSKEVQEIDKRNAEYQKRLTETSGRFET